MILAIAAAFMVGTTMSFVVSDFEAEAKPKPKDPDCDPICPPIFKPINATLFEILAQMDDLQDELDVIKSTGNDHGVILNDLQTTIDAVDSKADGIKSVVDTIDAKVP